MAPEIEKMRISSPDKVARILDRVAESGIPLILRPLLCPGVAVKGRAIPSSGSGLTNGIRVGNISEKGVKFLAEQAGGIIQVEFVLTSAKVMFQSRLINLSRQDCTLAVPSQLVSIERRRNARYPVTSHARAYMSFESWAPLANDQASPPFWDSTKEIGSLVPVGDVAIGGVSLVTRFPGICRVLDRGQTIESGQIHLPMMGVFKLEAAIRWCKRLRESVTEDDGNSRTLRLYKFGIQFINQSPELEKNIQIFIQRISQADAI